MKRVLRVAVGAALLTSALSSVGAAAANATPVIVDPHNNITAYCDRNVAHSGGDYTTSPLQNKAGWCLMQNTAANFGYTGTIDGVMGTNSWKYLQVFLKKEHGYTGPTDGSPGTDTYKAIQRWAAQNDEYTGPIDGAMGYNSWRGANLNAKIQYGAAD